MKHDIYATLISTSTALRNKWEFEYPAAELATAAKTQAEDRIKRKIAWQIKYDETLAKIKESGLNVREELALAMSNRSYGNGGPTIEIDSNLRSDLLECHERIQIHDRAIQEYEAWHSVMTAQKGRNVHLTHADWMFFFGGLDKGE